MKIHKLLNYLASGSLACFAMWAICWFVLTAFDVGKDSGWVTNTFMWKLFYDGVYLGLAYGAVRLWQAADATRLLVNAYFNFKYKDQPTLDEASSPVPIPKW